MKKEYLLPLVICLLSMITISCHSNKSSSNKQMSDNSDENSFYASNSDEAMILFEKLMNSFSPNWQEEEPAAEAYPPYYGGVFIDNDDNLVVFTVGEDANKYRSEIASIIGSEKFLTESVTYSYSELMSVMNKIDQFLMNPDIDENHPVFQNFGGAVADVFENRVVVSLLDTSTDVIAAFIDDISDSDAILFKHGNMMDDDDDINY